MPDDARDIILKRIRTNVLVGRGGKDVSGELPDSRTGRPAVSDFQRSAEESGSLGKSLFQRFEDELTLIGGSVRRVVSWEDLVAFLSDLCRSEAYWNLVLSGEASIEELGIEEELKKRISGLTLSKVSETNLIDQLRGADVGVTGCEYLVAETGTVVLRSFPEAPRALSLLPRAHIVIAREAQLLLTTASCLERLRAERSSPWSCITLVTGPSRTADIEKVLVKGVHGPKSLHVVVMGASV
jgi:L-lactate dehydrogenase complex protein LldG